MKITISNLAFNYGQSDVLKRISFDVANKELVSLVGPNGAGKSTLLKCLNRILKPSGGSVKINGENIARFSLKKLAHIFGYVPQASRHVFPSSVFDTVLLGRRPHLKWGVNAQNRRIVCRMLRLMRLDHLALRPFNELSGGEQQRVLIARALSQQPQVLLLDEPTSNLDLKHQLEVLTHVARIAKRQGLAVIMAIHDLNLAARYSDRIIFLKNGMIQCCGAPEHVLIPANIRSVYEVEVSVERKDGKPNIIPMGVLAN